MNERLGTLLIKKRTITDKELLNALTIQSQYGGRLGEILTMGGTDLLDCSWDS